MLIYEQKSFQFCDPPTLPLENSTTHITIMPKYDIHCYDFVYDNHYSLDPDLDHFISLLAKNVLDWLYLRSDKIRRANTYLRCIKNCVFF